VASLALRESPQPTGLGASTSGAGSRWDRSVERGPASDLQPGPHVPELFPDRIWHFELDPQPHLAVVQLLELGVEQSGRRGETRVVMRRKRRIAGAD